VSEFRYAELCPLARAAEVIGHRWSLLLLRELMLGPLRFGDLGRRLARISTSVLAERLAALERDGVVETAALPPPAPVRVYRLTAHGEAFRPALLALARWGLRWLSPLGRGDPFEPDGLRLSLPSLAAPGPTPARRFDLRVAGERIRFEGETAALAGRPRLFRPESPSRAPTQDLDAGAKQ
jgi:DNA-binding HxlR family transcriptional regulator